MTASGFNAEIVALEDFVRRIDMLETRLAAAELVADAARDYLTSDHYTDRATLIGALQDYDRLKRLGAD